MTKPQNALSTIEDNISQKQDGQQIDAKMAFAQRLRRSINDLGIKDAEVSRRSGLSTSALSSYLKGRSFPNSEQLFPLCDVLGVDPRWLISGFRASSDHLADASTTDWEQLPFYDLRDVTDTGMGEAKYYTRVRKDWLNRTFGRSKELWLTNLLSDYVPLDLHEGEQVICCKISREELHEGHLCIWRVLLLNQIIIGRYSLLHRGNQIAVHEQGEYWINPHLVEGDLDHGTGEDIIPIGRILGRFLQRI